MNKGKKAAAIILLLLYVMSSAQISVFAANGSFAADEAEYVSDSQTVVAEETDTPETEVSETDETEASGTETETEFDESGYDFSDMAPDDTLYGGTDYDYTDSMIQYDEFDDNIDTPTFEPGYDLSDNITLFAANTTTRNYENKITIELEQIIDSGAGDERVTNYGEDFECLADDFQLEAAVENWLVPLQDVKYDQHFFTMQGSCFGGGYWYFAFTVNYWNKNDTLYSQKGYMIVKVPENNLDDFLGVETAITYFEGVKINKLNDMTYNTITGELVIAACVDGDRDAVYTIDKENLEKTRKVSKEMVENEFVKYDVSCNVTSIAFSEKDGYYIVGLTGQIHLFAKLDYDFNLIGIWGDVSVDAGLSADWKRQTIFVDNNYIYNLLHLYNEKATSEEKLQHETENMIEIYDLSGEYKKTIYFTVPQGTDRRYEAENLNIVDGRLIIGFNCAEGIKYRDFCYYDFTENGFSVTYCSDDNIDAHITNGDLPASFVLRGFGAKLFTNPFSENGKAFEGWNAYRKEADKWFYESADKETRAWYKEGEQPEGYTKYCYANKAAVSQTGLLGEHVYMCAQWTASNNFTVHFKANSGSGEMTKQAIVHGTPTALNNNIFTKANRTFKGWNAYWVETKQWLYVSTGTDKTLKWCVEGSQPVGYKKYIYSDGETVSKTVHKGNQVIMYAVWDEFFIYYNPNGEADAAYELLPRKRGWNSGGNVNSISPFATAGFNGYNLYWREADKWLYYNSTTQDLEWFEKGAQTSGYSLYLKTFNADGKAYLGSTVPYGHSLVLYAKW